MWNGILTVERMKQKLFIHRVLFLHDVATRRAGKACTVRLSLQEWHAECDKMCFLGYVLCEMATCVDGAGDPLFSQDVLDAISKRAVEGTFI